MKAFARVLSLYFNLCTNFTESEDEPGTELKAQKLNSFFYNAHYNCSRFV
jgi:hypothetical protein